jgi:hypothetical protein
MIWREMRRFDHVTVSLFESEAQCMRFSARPKMGILLSLVTILTIVSAFLVSAAFGVVPTHAQSAQAAVKFHGIHGKVSSAYHGAMSQGHGSQTSSTQQLRAFVARDASTHASRASNTMGRGAPHVIGLHPAEGSLLHNFDGLSNVDNIKPTGFVFTPPDQGLCVGNLKGSKAVGEMVNTVLTFYSPSGAALTPVISLNAFFHEPPLTPTGGGFTSDPRCYFDATTNTWFFTILASDLNSSFAFTNSRIDVAVLNAASLTETVYKIDSTDATAPNCPCFGDQPHLGIDKNNVYISTDEYNLADLTTTLGASLFAISKSQLKAGTPANFVEFRDLNFGGLPVYTLQPAITNSDTHTEWLLNSFPFSDRIGTPNPVSNSLGLWAVNDGQNVTKGGEVELVGRLITSETYAFPVLAPSTKTPLNPDDDRMQQVQYINGHLWAALPSAVAITGDPVGRDGAAWFEIKPSEDHDVLGAAFTAQGYVAVAGNSLLYPAIEHTYEGTTMMTFTITSPTLNPSAAYTVWKSTGSGFGDIRIAARGRNGYIQIGFGPGLRWGDYSAAALDPNGKDIWMATEYIPPRNRQFITKTVAANWGTRVFEAQGDH